MRVLVKIISLLLTFLLGFVTCLGALVGAGYFVYAHVSLDTLNVSTDKFHNKEAAEVSLSSMTLEDMMAEMKELSELGDAVNFDMLVIRYGLIVSDEIERFLPETLRTVPLKELLSDKGLETLYSNLYMGQLFEYEAIEMASPELAGYKYKWIDPETGLEVNAVNSKLANHTLAEFLDGGIDTSEFVDGMTVAELLGYQQVDGVWYSEYLGPGDAANTKLSSVMTVIADSKVNEIERDINKALVGELIGYTKIVNPDWQEGDNEDDRYVWLDENGAEAHVLMSAVSDKKLSELDTVVDTLTIADLIPEDQRQTGFVSLVSPETTLDGIHDELDRVFNENTIGTFVEKGAITFSDTETETAEQRKERFLASDFADMKMPEMINWLLDNAIE